MFKKISENKDSGEMNRLYRSQDYRYPVLKKSVYHMYKWKVLETVYTTQVNS